MTSQSGSIVSPNLGDLRFSLLKNGIAVKYKYAKPVRSTWTLQALAELIQQRKENPIPAPTFYLVRLFDSMLDINM